MRPRSLYLLISAAMALGGCDRLFDKGSKEKIEAAEQKVRAGDPAGAIPLYEGALDGTARTADVHYRLGLLYADKLHSPMDALHHYGRYLELAPIGPHAKEAQAYKAEGERLVLGSFTKGSAITQAEAMRLKNENLRLQNELAAIRNQEKLAAAALPPAARGESQRKPIPPGARTYIVQSGDNFGKISLKFYKTKARAAKIQNANFMPQNSTPVIKPGMELYIPQ